MTDKNDGSLNLKNFVCLLKTFIDGCKQTGKIVFNGHEREIQLAPRVVIRRKVKNLAYEAGNISQLQTESQTTVGPSWLSVEYIIEDYILNSNEYAELISYFSNLYKSVDARKIIQIFFKKVLKILLDGEDNLDRELNEILEACLNSLSGKPAKYGAEAFIYGITLDINKVQIRVGGTQILIRRLIGEDFEFKGSVEDFIKMEEEKSLVPVIPSTKLQIEFFDTSGKSIYLQAQRIIAVLRLFKVGSVGYSRLKEYSTSLTDEKFVGLDENNYITSSIHYMSDVGNLSRGLDSYSIGNRDLSNLTKFTEVLFHKIPTNFYDTNLKKNYLSLAYERYVVALLDSRSPIYRIATAVMGLESIYLTENMELKYRLSIRTARVLSIFADRSSSFSPITVRELIKLSYDIRSTFVHGNEPENGLLNKVKKQCFDIDNLLQVTLDYLRVSITLCLTLNLSKKEFVPQIDNSFIDDGCLIDLKEKLLSVKDSIFI